MPPIMPPDWFLTIHFYIHDAGLVPGITKGQHVIFLWRAGSGLFMRRRDIPFEFLRSTNPVQPASSLSGWWWGYPNPEPKGKYYDQFNIHQPSQEKPSAVARADCPAYDSNLPMLVTDLSLNQT